MWQIYSDLSGTCQLLGNELHLPLNESTSNAQEGRMRRVSQAENKHISDSHH